MNKNFAIGIVLVAIVAIGAFLFLNGSQKSGGVQATTDISTSNFTTISASNGVAIGGVFVTAARNSALTAATTTPCAIQSPNATSTLAWPASLVLTVSSTTASIVTIGVAATPYATTTVIGQLALAANAQGTVVSTTTPAGGMNLLVIPPSNYIVFGMQGGTGTFSPTGICQASFVVLN